MSPTTVHFLARCIERGIDPVSAERVAREPFVVRVTGPGCHCALGPGRDPRGRPVWVCVVVADDERAARLTVWRADHVPGARGTEGPAPSDAA